MVLPLEQLVFDIPVHASLSIEDFVVGPNNEKAVKLVEIWPDWPGHCLVLVGQKASGKSHLAGIWRIKAKALLIDPDKNDWAKLFQKGQPVLVENAHLVKNEEGLFHIYNWTKETGGHFLLTAQHPPSKWNLKLADLSSRLKTAPLATIDLPDDKLLASILTKHFSDRQIIVEDKVIRYLVLRIERTFESAKRVSKDLDDIAFKEGKKITTGMVRNYLETQFEP
jgi:chromosomal replication initiation ATPase DnaA